MRKYLYISILIHCIFAVVFMFIDDLEKPVWVYWVAGILLFNAFVILWIIFVIYGVMIEKKITKWIEDAQKKH